MKTTAEASTEALKDEIESYKKLGIVWSKKSLKQSLGIKYYLMFWKRKRLICEEIIKRAEEEKR